MNPNGVKIWDNKKNGWTVFELHYSADPSKDEAWAEKLKPTMAKSQWEREFELKWRTYGGVRVYEDFSRSMHVNDTDEDAAPGFPLVLGIDFGLTPAAVIGQFIGIKLLILDELCEFNMPISEFAEKLSIRLRQNWPDHAHYDVVDPSGFHRSQVDGRRCVDELIKQGFSPEPGPMGFVDRKENVIRLLTTLHRGEARLKINPRCDYLIAGFEGGYKYEDNITKRDKPIKNEFSHVHDALQYACGLTRMQEKPMKKISIRRASYGFQKY